MNTTERLIYLITICLLAAALGGTAYQKAQPLATASFRHIEIQDARGHVRMILGTDANGTAELRFVSDNGDKASQIQQYRDGSTSMRFAGSADTPGIVIGAMQHGLGPIISLAGDNVHERMYLGSVNYQDDVPSTEPYGWGLYVPAGGFKPPYAAIGAYRNLKTGEIRGFVHPEK